MVCSALAMGAYSRTSLDCPPSSTATWLACALKTRGPKVFKALNEGWIVVAHPFKFVVGSDAGRTTEAFK